MKPTDPINRPLGAALCRRLRDRGIRIASTVAPATWTPIDPQLEADAEQESKWANC